MAMQINGVTMPASIENYSVGYVYNPFPATVTDGEGNVLSVGYPEIVWTFERLTAAEFNWWATTICTGLPSKKFTSAALYNNLDTLITFSNLVVQYPTFDSREYGTYQNVTIKITQLVE